MLLNEPRRNIQKFNLNKTLPCHDFTEEIKLWVHELEMENKIVEMLKRRELPHIKKQTLQQLLQNHNI